MRFMTNTLPYLKANLELPGLGHMYHDIWWKKTAYFKSPLTKWNYSHGAIFIHIPKTAGLSIYDMFEMERSYDTHAPIAAYLAADIQFTRSSFKFAVVRNPWERLLSAYQYLKFGTASTTKTFWHQDALWSEKYLVHINSFQQFLRALRKPQFRGLVLSWRHFIPQHYFLTTGNSSILVNRLVRFENLHNELFEIASRLGLKIALLKINESTHSSYEDYYTEADADFVGHVYRRDLELFNYRFGSEGSL